MSEKCETCDPQTCEDEACKKKMEEQARLKETLAGIKHTIMVMSGKGGVGKSTVAANLALSLAREGYKVGVLDADIHGPNIPKVLGVENQSLRADENDGIHPVESRFGLKVVSVGYLLESQDTPVIWRGPMKHAVIQQFMRDVNWGELDFLVVDLPPGTGDEPLSIAQVVTSIEGIDAPAAVVVTTPQDVALLDSRKSVEFAGALKLNFLGIIENMSGMVCPHCGETIDLFKTGGGEKAANELDVPFLGAVPLDPRVVINTDDGTPFVLSDDGDKVNEAFKKVVNGVLDAF